MYIVVCVKQVKNVMPTLENKSSSEYIKNNEMFNNPFDLAAVSWAVRLKELYAFNVVTVSMGPLSAASLVRQLFSYGVDRALLLTNANLSGSDTYATSYSIGKLIKTILPDYSMIICGDKSLDGETGQVPYSMAAELNINSFPNVSDIIYHDGMFDVICNMDLIKSQLTSKDKILVTVNGGPNGYNCLPTIKNILESKSKEIEIINGNTLGLCTQDVGYRGSFTKVVSLHNRKTGLIREAHIQYILKRNKIRWSF